ncbi:MAG: hypothetical protein LC637_04645, partial [Xanthomonadaceae bacterium]|nr:hypothetical protein [Xanthomonadaceae bacterium]
IAEPLPTEAVSSFDGICPIDAPTRDFTIAAVSAQQALSNGTLEYNSRPGAAGLGPLHDPTALMYVRTSDLSNQNRLLPGVPIEPLILRAAAGECIKITLENRFDRPLLDLPGASKMPDIIQYRDPNAHPLGSAQDFDFGADHVRPSEHVGLHAQMVAYDVTQADGVNAGFNPVQSVGPGQQRTFEWYAGTVAYNGSTFSHKPMEFGAVGLTSSDPIKASNKGLVGTLIIEPEGSSWTEEPQSRASADVQLADGSKFREHVLVVQNDINLRYWPQLSQDLPSGAYGKPVPNLAVSENAAESGHPAYNYRTEPIWFRLGYAPDAIAQVSLDRTDMDIAFLDSTDGQAETPRFISRAGEAVRMRVVHPAGHAQNHTFSLHGHTWQELPWNAGSSQIASNPVSEIKGFRDGLGPSGHWNMPLRHGAGGPFGVRGEFMYRDLVPWYLAGGLWGVFVVE